MSVAVSCGPLLSVAVAVISHTAERSKVGGDFS